MRSGEGIILNERLDSEAKEMFCGKSSKQGIMSQLGRMVLGTGGVTQTSMFVFVFFVARQLIQALAGYVHNKKNCMASHGVLFGTRVAMQVGSKEEKQQYIN